MQEQAAVSDQTHPNDHADHPAADAAFGTRIRTSLALAQTRITAVPGRARAQLTEIPSHLRGAFDRVVTHAQSKVRSALDLPSRGDLASLLERVEAIDARLSDLQESAPSDGKSSNGVDKVKRRDAIKDAATKPVRGKAKKSPK
ncbi:MAG TPA: hypothetical protein VML75_28480 [Kofleriaceae bacterium]|nr:hypothetical protein [Kofleriaceae bacterium]